MNIKTILISLLIFLNLLVYGNGSSTAIKSKIAVREVIWGITHPFIALKVKRLTKEALSTTDSLQKYNVLFDKSGGQLDAFKHSYWMALLSQEIKIKKARRIGIIHEKVNYKSFKRNHSVQDSAASEMDLLNNEVGIALGSNNKSLSKKELTSLTINYIKLGKMYIIKKDDKGNCLDKDNKIIDLSVEKEWDKRKCIIGS